MTDIDGAKGMGYIKSTGLKSWEILVSRFGRPMGIEQSEVVSFSSPGALIYYCNDERIRIINKKALLDLWASHLKY